MIHNNSNNNSTKVKYKLANKGIKILLAVLFAIAIAVPAITITTGCNGGDQPMQVVAGFAHTVVLRQDGTVWAWGRNEEGQLGNGNRANQFRPVRFRIENFFHADINYTPPNRIVQVASHKIHTMALGDDGSVWAGGWNQEGQLGAPVGCRTTPIRVPFPDHDTRIIDIDAGMLFSIALRDTGHIYGWGRNRHNFFGAAQGDINQLARAQRIYDTELNNIRQISAGHEHVLALRGDGAVLAFGRNRNGQVGNVITGGMYATQGVATVVNFPTNPNIVEVRGGGFHSLARCSEGNVYAWGRSDRGQIGDGVSHAATSQPIPQRVVLPRPAIYIASSSGDSNAAILNDGSVYTWGRNDQGQLGHGTVGYVYNGDIRDFEHTPRRVMRGQGTPLSNIISVGVGEKHMSAICGDSGEVFSWGTNWDGEHGSNTVMTSGPARAFRVMSGTRCPITTHSPAPIIGSEPLTGVRQLSAGNLFSLALMYDNTVAGWGRNDFGQLLMQHSIDHRVATPLHDFRATDPRFGQIAIDWGRNMRQSAGDEHFGTLDNMSVVSASSHVGHSFGLGVRGYYAYGWGDNQDGWLGHGYVRNSRRTLGEMPKDNNPRRMTFLGGGYVTAIDVSAGGRHSLILRPNGTVYAAGHGANGRLGDGATDRRDHPVRVNFPTNATFPAGSYIRAIEAGIASSFAIDNRGYLWAWGSNGNGRLGVGGTEQRITPTRVLGPSLRAGNEQVVAVSSMTYHTLALTSGGRVFSWGAGWSGRLGHGNTNQLEVPTHINSVVLAQGVRAIAAGNGHSVAVLNDGTVATWGDNGRYRLGRSSTWAQQQTPNPVPNLRDVRQVVAGSEFTVVLVLEEGESYSESRVYSFGSNNAGALGSGGTQTITPRDDNAPRPDDRFTIQITANRHPFAVTRAAAVHGNGLFRADRADFPPVTVGEDGPTIGSIVAWTFIGIGIFLGVVLIAAIVLFALYKTWVIKKMWPGFLDRFFSFLPPKRKPKKTNSGSKNKKKKSNAKPSGSRGDTAAKPNTSASRTSYGSTGNGTTHSRNTQTSYSSTGHGKSSLEKLREAQAERNKKK